MYIVNMNCFVRIALFGKAVMQPLRPNLLYYHRMACLWRKHLRKLPLWMAQPPLQRIGCCGATHVIQVVGLLCSLLMY